MGLTGTNDAGIYIIAGTTVTEYLAHDMNVCRNHTQNFSSYTHITRHAS